MSDIIQRDTLSPQPIKGTSVPNATLVSVLTAFISAPGSSTGPSPNAPIDCGIDLLKFSTKSFQLINRGAQPLTAAKVQVTNVPAEQRQASDWVDFDTTTFATLAAGTTKQLTVNLDVNRYWRIQCGSTNGTTIDAILTAGG